HPVPAPPTKKMTTREAIQYDYQKAMASKRIELLEAYITKYSSRRYRSWRRTAKIDSVRATLRTLRMEIGKEMAFNKAYPRFGKTGVPEVPVSVKGLSHATEAAFRTAWDYLRPDMAKWPGIRLPAKLNIDYSSQPPILTLDAFVIPEYDIEKITINSRQAFRVSCLLTAMKHLQRLKMMTIALLNQGRTGSKSHDIIDYEVNKVGSAIYLLRLMKPAKSGAILFYARDNGDAGNDTANLIQFYDFYDITAAGHDTRRFPIYPGSLPNVIPSLASDPLEQVMGTDFFGE
ncbi:MAG: hypothetical protein JXA18_11525, partial [Chitinispirillaceae bacterium]|nr:hypothetical protein [Chitinispirillaceae bacterium]